MISTAHQIKPTVFKLHPIKLPRSFNPSTHNRNSQAPSHSINKNSQQFKLETRKIPKTSSPTTVDSKK
jgi:hypothetical protein